MKLAKPMATKRSDKLALAREQAHLARLVTNGDYANAKRYNAYRARVEQHRLDTLALELALALALELELVLINTLNTQGRD